MNSYSSESYAKCIISGEHSVLRGCPALVIPVKSCALKSTWDLSDKPLELSFSGEHSRELSLVFSGVLDQACRSLSLRRDELKGQWRLENNIQLGGGLGASAAICVSIARYLVSLNKISEDSVYSFSQNLEDLFHGESSGVDIAASMSSGPLKFVRYGDRKKIDPMWSPLLYVSYSGHKGMTSDCVEQVKKFISNDRLRGNQLDRKMQESVELAVKAFEVGEKIGKGLLIDSMNLSAACFEEWGLIDSQMYNEVGKLKKAGAIAVKPTGSGRGGYLLSLWDSPPAAACGDFYSVDY